MTDDFKKAISLMNPDDEGFIGDELPEDIDVDVDDTDIENLESDSEDVSKKIEVDSEEPVSGRSKRRKKQVKGRKRILTENFLEEVIIDATDYKAFNEWQAKMYKKGYEHIYYDRRNYIYCAGPTGNFTMMRNYFTLLNNLSSMWVNYDLFDQGYLPYVYWPSFKVDDEGIIPNMVKLAARANIELLEVSPSSLFTKTRVAGLKEYWIKRKDLMALMDYVESKVPGISFGPRDEDSVSMVNYVAAYAREEAKNA